MSDTPWYKEGLRFGCTQCGKCCTGSPGFVWVTEEEIRNLADTLKISVDQFMRTYVRKIGTRYSLLEHRKNYDCVFLKNNQCSVYAARPKQCRTFPWWKDNLETPEAWEEVKARCEGAIHKDAPFFSLEEIQKSID